MVSEEDKQNEREEMQKKKRLKNSFWSFIIIDFQRHGFDLSSLD
jgi:hypothetical protein